MAAILCVIIMLRSRGRANLVPPVVAIIVGLHFIGLRMATGEQIFLLDTVGLVAVGLCMEMRVRRPAG